ncbi:hypothetical protein FAI40_04065 [Acetobacteraceae bacterium]|nr:hypothetical protein FAI40_04065 [Acetobacteraceae bacterium]
MKKSLFLAPFFLFLIGCNATVNGPFLNHLKKENREAADLQYVAAQLLEFPDLKEDERVILRYQMRKVDSEKEALSNIAHVVRTHIESPWWEDWFFPFDGWGETPFYVSDESIALNQLFKDDLKDLKLWTDSTQKRFGVQIHPPSKKKMTSKERKAEKEAEAEAAQLAKAQAQGKTADPFVAQSPAKPDKSPKPKAKKLPQVPQVQQGITDYLGDEQPEEKTAQPAPDLSKDYAPDPGDKSANASGSASSGDSSDDSSSDSGDSSDDSGKANKPVDPDAAALAVTSTSN